MIHVTNQEPGCKYKPTPEDVVIDISYPSVLSNDYRIGRGYGVANMPQRMESIRKYRRQLEAVIENGKGPVYEKIMEIVELAKDGKSVALDCWCAPFPCHGDVIQNLVLEILYKKYQITDHK